MGDGELAFCVLASGSGGNCSALHTPHGTVLLDLGIGPRTFCRRAADSGMAISLSDIRAVCLTHLDSDHLNHNWLTTLVKHDIAVHCHASHLDAFTHRFPKVRAIPFADDAFEPLPDLRGTAIRFAHDEAGSHGFVFDGSGVRVGYATDLGHVPDLLLNAFCDLDILAIESNYDRQMQLDSGRPWFLKNRVMGGSGHLSNAQAYAAVRELLNRCEQHGGALPRHIVLLHRSRECNCPDLLRRYFARDARIAPRLVLSDQRSPTPWLRAEPLAGEQLSLAWG